MKQFLKHKSRRPGYHGWAVMVKGSDHPWPWTVCTTRKELRELIEAEKNWMRTDIEIVKVKIEVTLA